MKYAPKLSRCRVGLLYSIIVVSFSLLNAIGAVAADQEITLSGIDSDVSVVYSVSDGDAALLALGFRVHFDSKTYAFSAVRDFFEKGSLLKAPQLHGDKADFDNDPATDRFLLFAYSEPMKSDWPGVALPLRIATIAFERIGAPGAAGSPLNVTKVTGHAGYGFKGHGIRLWGD